MQYFIADNLDLDYYSLSSEESKHCIKVLRMGVGDTLMLTDGNGTLCKAKIITASPKECEVEIVERKHEEQKPYRLHIGVAPTKNSARIEWFVEKAVEIGVDRITLLVCDHSEREKQNTERLQKIIDSAMKQSLKAYRPALEGPMPILDFIRQADEACKMVCYCDGDERHTMHEAYQKGRDAVVLIGPEGDFSQKEISTALELGFQPVTLGSCRLRTETAALYAVTAVNFLNEN